MSKLGASSWRRSGQRARQRPAGVPVSAWRFTGCRSRVSLTYFNFKRAAGGGCRAWLWVRERRWLLALLCAPAHSTHAGAAGTDGTRARPRQPA